MAGEESPRSDSPESVVENSAEPHGAEKSTHRFRYECPPGSGDE
jgi:hypothetical protein